MHGPPSIALPPVRVPNVGPILISLSNPFSEVPPSSGWAMRARIPLTLLTACAILAIGFSYQGYRDRQQPDDPDWLLQQADEQAWLNDWMSAALVYHKAELLYQQRNEQA